jgi:2-alkyl-3-oxoalkanoate reductase
MKVFVTGGTGFVGRHLLTALHRAGHQVTALSRSAASDPLLMAVGAQPLRGTLTDLPQWQSALAGHQALIHAASPVEFWGPWTKFYQEITQATVALYGAAVQAQIPRFIYLSSESVLQDRQALLDVDETYPYPAQPNSYYGQAKRLAEVGLLESAQNTTSCIILRPPFVWGPQVKALQDIVAKVQQGQFIWVDQGRAVMEMVHVENLVAALLLALRRGEHRNVYFVTDDQPLTVREFLTPLLQTQQINPPKISLPSALLQPLATLLEGVWRYGNFATPPPLSRFELAFVSMPRRYSIQKIKQALGYRPVMDFSQGLKNLSRHC